MIDSQPLPVLSAGENCWRIARAEKVRVIIDAVDYFRVLRHALAAARHSVLIVGWDFDNRILLDPDDDSDTPPNQVGALLDDLAAKNPAVAVHVLRWDLAALSVPLRGSTPIVLLDWLTHDNIHFKLDNRHPIDACHHQKLVVIDDSLAFCGGIDITAGRWDTPAHRDEEPHRRGPAGDAYPPWHDATVAVSGAAAKALGDLARARWQVATGDLPALPPAGIDHWPAALASDFTDIDLAIARTLPAYDGVPLVAEIEALYLAAIASARCVIYLESQYFSAPVIADALAARLAEADGPAVIIINPRTADGWLEAKLMDSARAVLLARLHAADSHGRLRFCTPVTALGADIYVHAKILVIDDRLLRVGSSNLNKRSLATDSECDLAIEAKPDDTASRAAITRIRDTLIAEHLGLAPADWAAALAAGDLLAAFDAMIGTRPRTLRHFVAAPLDAVELALAEAQISDSAFEGFAKAADAALPQVLMPPRRFRGWIAAGITAAGLALLIRRRR
jgi:phospholipase D1/2